MEKNIKVVFANQKGGVGKSTLCILLADYLAWKGKPVCVIDTDLQKTTLMQRRKDAAQREAEDGPYSVQDFDVAGPEQMQELVQAAEQTEGFVLFDTPGNVSQDGLLPLFAGADFIVCPFDYDDKTLDSTGTFVAVIAAIRDRVPSMRARMLFVPNRIDPRVGTKEELRMWREADKVLSAHGLVLPPVPARALLRRADTFEITPRQRGYVRDCFEIMLWEMAKGSGKTKNSKK